MLTLCLSSKSCIFFRMFAFRALSEAGAQLTTSESAILGFVEDAKHPKFRDIAALIKNSAPDSGLTGTPV